MAGLRVDLGSLSQSELRSLARNAQAAGNTRLAQAALDALSARPHAYQPSGLTQARPRRSWTGRSALLGVAVVALATLTPPTPRQTGEAWQGPPLPRTAKAYVAIPSPAPALSADDQARPTRGPTRIAAAVLHPVTEAAAAAAGSVVRAEIARAPEPPPARAIAPTAAPASSAPLVMAASGSLLPRDCGSSAYAGRLHCSGGDVGGPPDAFTRSAAELNTSLNGNLLSPGGERRERQR